MFLWYFFCVQNFFFLYFSLNKTIQLWTKCEHKLEIGIFWTCRRMGRKTCTKWIYNALCVYVRHLKRMAYKLIFSVQKFARRIVSLSPWTCLTIASQSKLPLSRHSAPTYTHTLCISVSLALATLSSIAIHPTAAFSLSYADTHTHTLRTHIIYDISSLAFLVFGGFHFLRF